MGHYYDPISDARFGVFSGKFSDFRLLNAPEIIYATGEPKETSDEVAASISNSVLIVMSCTKRKFIQMFATDLFNYEDIRYLIEGHVKL